MSRSLRERPSELDGVFTSRSAQLQILAESVDLLHVVLGIISEIEPQKLGKWSPKYSDHAFTILEPQSQDAYSRL